MARITVIDSDVKASIYLQDLERRQRQTIFPPGQDQYIRPIDLAALQAKLDALGSAVLAAAFVAATVDVDDISLATLEAEAGVVLTPEQAQELQDVLSARIVETGNFLLSFDRGQISKLIEQGTVKVFTENGSGLFVL
jgi:chaperone required for assembly of F1-ATPase